MFKSLIIGNGEIGKALHRIVDGDIIDKEENLGETEYQYDILHICFPYSEEFEKEVKRYQKLYHPKYTVIHSTVPVGTSKKCNAIHSPIEGIHPNLERSLLTFTKFLGGDKAGEVSDYFRRFGMKVYITDKSETTELMKLMSTTFYGVCIEYFKDVKKQCDKYKIPFEMWTLYNIVYNQGYTDLGEKQFIRPNLIPNMQKISGHCVLPNTELIETNFTKLLKDLSI